MKTKLISALLATALMLSLIMTAPVAVFAADLPSSWAVDSVDRAKSLELATPELINGFTSTTTRAEFCRAAVNFLRKYGYNVDSVTPKLFEDTNDRDIGVAAALKITSGNNTAGTQFAPDLDLTREQAATMLRNVMDVIGVKYSVTAAKWTDAKDISSWAKEAVDVMYGAKIMGGTSTTSLVFSPKTPYTHEASIATLVSLWEYSQKAAVTSQTSAHKYDMNDPNVKKHPIYATSKTAKELVAANPTGVSGAWQFTTDKIAAMKNDDPDYMIDGKTFYDWRFNAIQTWVDKYLAGNNLSIKGKTDYEKTAIIQQIVLDGWHAEQKDGYSANGNGGRLEEFIGLWRPNFRFSSGDCVPRAEAVEYLMIALNFELSAGLHCTLGEAHATNAYWDSTAGAVRFIDADNLSSWNCYVDELDEKGFILD